MANSTTKFTLKFDSPDTNKYLSSGELADLVASGLVTSDFLYTFISRYPRLNSDLNNMHGNTTTSNGSTIDYTAEHSWLGIFQTIVVLCTAVGTSVVTYRGMTNAKARSSYQVVYSTSTKTESAPASDAKDIKHSPDNNIVSNENALRDFNNALNAVLEKNEKLKQRYKKINIGLAYAEETTSPAQSSAPVAAKKPIGLNVEIEKTPEPKEVTFWELCKNYWNKPWAVQKPAISSWMENWKKPWVVKKAVIAADTGSNMLGLVSYAYWIFFIAAAVVTGIFGSGVGGVTDWLAFGLPMAVGCTYVGLKLKNKYSNRNVKVEEQNDFNALYEETALTKEENEVTKGLKNQDKVTQEASLKMKMPSVSKSAIVNAAVITGIGAYVSWQYNMWYATDLLSKVFTVAVESAAEAIGIGILVTACVALTRAAYNAYQDYKKNQNTKDSEPKAIIKNKWDHLKLESTLLLEQQVANIQKLENDIALLEQKVRVKTPILDARIDQLKQADEKSKTRSWVQNIRNVLHVANFGMTGVYLARTILVRGVTSFLLPGLAAAVCLSNPWTIALLVLAGVAWGTYKYYNYRKEKNLQKISDANKRIDLLERKKNILKKYEANLLEQPVLSVKPEPESATPAKDAKELDPQTNKLTTSASAPALTMPAQSEVELAPKAIVPPALPFFDEEEPNTIAAKVQSKRKMTDYSKAELVNKYGCFAHANKVSATVSEALEHENIVTVLPAAAAAA